MSANFKLGTFSREGAAPFAGLVQGDQVYPLSDLQPLLNGTNHTLSGADSLLNLMQDWEGNFAALEFAVAQPGFSQVVATPLAALQVEVPLRPSQIFCAGANYREHVIEIMMNEDPGGAGAHLSREERREQAAKTMDERAASGIPFVFVKTAAALNRAEGEIVLPSDVTKPDWELELAVVIGKKARRVSREDALDYVAGYAVANDLSARERQYRSDMKIIGADWLAAKCAPGFLPLGPFMTPKAFVPDAEKLRLKLTLNGQTMQDACTDDMVFGIARLIEYVSSLTELWPGDVLLTGSPPGNASHHGRFLQAGDVLEGEIEGLGQQHHLCVAEGIPDPAAERTPVLT